MWRQHWALIKKTIEEACKSIQSTWQTWNAVPQSACRNPFAFLDNKKQMTVWSDVTWLSENAIGHASDQSFSQLSTSKPERHWKGLTHDQRKSLSTTEQHEHCIPLIKHAKPSSDPRSSQGAYGGGLYQLWPVGQHNTSKGIKSNYLAQRTPCTSIMFPDGQSTTVV